MTILQIIDQLIKQNSETASEIAAASSAQRSYSFASSHEAKIFFDVLTAQGFEVKLYRESAANKLHIALPKKRLVLADGWQHPLAHQIKTALIIKNNIEAEMKQSADEGAEFSLSISALPAGGQQITIILPKPHGLPASSSMQKSTAPELGAAKTITAPSYDATAKYRAISQDNSIYTGPDVMNQPGINLAKLMKIDESQDTLWRRIKLYVKGNIFYTMLVLVGCFVGLIAFISLFVLSKAVLCPDFAHLKDKNPPWYCTYK